MKTMTSKNTKKLSEIAKVGSGLVLSRKAAKEEKGIVYDLLTLRAIQADGNIDMSLLDVFEAKESLSSDYITQRGDIVIRLSVPYTAVLIDESTEGMVVSSNFVLIRCEKEKLIPEYLFWLLNTRKIRRELLENTTGSVIGTIKAKYFSDFAIELLSVANQEKIATIDRLARREHDLLLRLAEERGLLYDHLLSQVQKEMRRGTRV